MTYLSKTVSGKIKKPFHVVIYGTPKVGKTTWASDAEMPIFMDIEGGSSELDVIRLPKPASFKEVLNILQELIASEHSFKTLVIDSLDHLETLCNQETANENGVASVGDMGFGKGYAQSLAKWQKLYVLLGALQKKMNLICIAHSCLKKIEDPTKSAAYDKYDVKLRDALGAISKEKADAILFAVFETNLIKDRNTGKAKAIGDGSRILYTQGRPGHEGGNRFNLPHILPLSFSDFISAMNDCSEDKLKEKLNNLLNEITDEELKIKVIKARDSADSDSIQLTKIIDRLETILNTKGN